MLDETNNAASVPYGLFTGRVFPVAAGPLPAQAPRYLIERLPDRGQRAGAHASIYRITAIGFGMRGATQAVVQSYYRKKPSAGGAAAVATGRIGWREFNHWSEASHDSTGH